VVNFDGKVLRVNAPLTMTRARTVVEAGLPFLKGGEVVVDLSAVTEADSSALAVLLAWQREQRRKSGSLRVIGVPAGLSSIARVYGAEAEIDGIAPADGR
jgi:phospholipid transport system transporter-binding protein